MQTDAQMCPDPVVLQQYAAGKLSAADSDRIRTHLANCDTCNGSVHTLNLGAARSPDSGDQPTMASAPKNRDDGTDLVGQQLRQYKIMGPVGRGGMGTVYRAIHQRLQREVAIKVLPKSSLQDDDAVERFHREMQAVGQLQHVHIATAFDADEVDGIHFLAMELVNGPNLSQLVRCLGPLPVAEACELIRMSAQALQAAHQKGLVHRDIKPSNLLLAEGGDVKLLDLGLALLSKESHSNSELTQTGQIMGTVDYMAPEQAVNTHTVDIRADIYSLGCTLFYLLTGIAPFDEGTTIQKLMAHASAPIPKVTTVRNDVPPEVAKVLQRMLAKAPEDRPNPPKQVAELLQPLADGADTASLWTRFVDLQRFAASKSKPASGQLGGLTQNTEDDGVGPTALHIPSEDSTTKPPLDLADITDADLEPTEIQLPDTQPDPSTGMRKLAVGLVAGILATSIGAAAWFNGGGEQVAMNTPKTRNIDRAVSPSNPDGVSNDREGIYQGGTNGKHGSDGMEDENQKTVGVDDPPAPAPVRSQDPKPPTYDGTQQHPFLVSTDSNGSHVTITAAIADAKEAQSLDPSIRQSFIQVASGVYEEALSIDCSIDLSLQPDADAPAVIRNAVASPIYVQDAMHQLTLRNLTIMAVGSGDSDETRFNAIDLQNGGQLVMNDCRVFTSTYNAIKLKSGAAFMATDCYFGSGLLGNTENDQELVDSESFAISAAQHRSVDLNNCSFSCRGVQIQGGDAKFTDCLFSGPVGVQVYANNKIVEVLGCTFKGNTETGITVAESGTVSTDKSNFIGCRRGAWVSRVDPKAIPGTLYVTGSTWSNCETAIHVQNGALTMDRRCVIHADELEAESTGIQIDQAEWRPTKLTDCEIRDVTKAILLAAGQLECESCNIKNSKRGIEVNGGQLTVKYGMILECERSFVLTGSQQGSIAATITGTSISGGEYGLVAMASDQAAEQPDVEITLSGVSFKDQETCMAAIGNTIIQHGDCNFAPLESGAKVKTAGDVAQIKEL